jgi:hypothetical protein
MGQRKGKKHRIRYYTVETPTDLRRTFTITLGLVAEYDTTNAIHHPETAYRVALRWMGKRAKKNKPTITGFFSEITLLYAWRNKEKKVLRIREPALRFWGEVSLTHLHNVSDADIKTMLNKLADKLGAALDQTRVYVSFRDQAWIREAEGKTSPRADLPIPTIVEATASS